MEEFPSNSRRAKIEPVEREKVEAVVTGTVVRRKKPLGRRLIETFFGSDDARGVWQYVTEDVLIPAAKDMVTDAITGGVERAIFGEVRGRGRGPRGGAGGSYVSYNKYSSGGSPIGGRSEAPRRELSRSARSNHNFDELVYQTKPEAEEVLDKLYFLVEKYGVATIADFYEASDVEARFTDQKYGWTDLTGVDVARIRGGGYILTLPRTEPI